MDIVVTIVLKNLFVMDGKLEIGDFVNPMVNKHVK
tara:strand:- start:3 stop:107 length:105 start_codon:yes stop_codon:yes gene_type:complete